VVAVPVKALSRVSGYLVAVAVLFLLAMLPAAVAQPSGATGEPAEIPCTAHCDCPQGMLCYREHCISDPNQPIYCCAKPGCSPGRWCFNPDGSKGDCAEDPTYHCDTTCDCGPAHCCKNNVCVKDIDDPLLPGGTQVGTPCLTGDPTYCSTDGFCHSGRVAYGDAFADFRCQAPTGEVSAVCGGSRCWFGGDCEPGETCLEANAWPQPVVAGQFSTSDGGTCVSTAVAEATYGVASGSLLTACAWGCLPGQLCEAGWRPGNDVAIEVVVAKCGSCGNGTCDTIDLETSVTCPADCSCGDGQCDTSEVGTCTADCGTCDGNGCEQPILPLEWDTMSTCGDGICQHDGDVPEDCVNCRLDCDAQTDSDGDGTPNGCDLCPTDPGKVQPGVCGCSVPDTDTDADTHADCSDNCPFVANATQADFDNDTIGDACDADVDGDGVANAADRCPWTTIPDPLIPTLDTLGTGRWALLDADGTFDTAMPIGSPAQTFTLTDTGGCNAEQIASELRLNAIAYRRGLSTGDMLRWIATPGA
jgi:hypothetical protein